MNGMTMQILIGGGSALAVLLAIVLFGALKKKREKQRLNREWKTIGGPVTVAPRSKGEGKGKAKDDAFSVVELTPEQKMEECFQAAETYCAFGHFDRAREELRAALNILPGNPEALVKLCRIEGQERNREALRAALTELAASTGKSGPHWAEGVKIAQEMVANAPAVPAGVGGGGAH